VSKSRADEYVSICCALSILWLTRFPLSPDVLGRVNKSYYRTLQDDISDAQGYIDCNDVELGIMVIKCSINKVL
jgi:hypothetical protein